MKLKLFIVIQIFVISFLVISSCKNTEKDEKNTLDNRTKLESEIAPDSLQVKVDTIVAKDTARTEPGGPTYYGCHYKVEPLSQIEYKLNGRVKKVELYSYSDFKTVNGKIVPDMNTEWYHYQVNFKSNGEYDWDDLGRISGGGYFYTYEKDSLNRPTVKYMVFVGMGDSTKIVCSYDDINNTKTETHITSYDNSVVQKYHYFYDINGNLKMLKSIDDRREISFKEEWNYDDKNNIISYDRYDYENNELMSKTHEYYYYIFDDHNNWIKCYKYNEDNELFLITVRNITYY